MSGIIDTVKGVVGGVTDTLFGGKPEVNTTTNSNYSPITDQEKSRLQDIETKINQLFGGQASSQNTALSQSPQIQQLFADNLKKFMTNNGQATPADIQKASDFVDQTFTNPTQKVVDQNVNDYQSQAQGRAAALGRNPNLDIATQQAIAGEGLRQNIGLQSERGSRIQQATKDQYTQNLGALNAGMQGSGYLNNLAQQAFSNQMNLLNGRTGLAQFYQQGRGQNSQNFQSTTPGLLGQITNGASQIGGAITGVGQLGQLTGIGSSNSNSYQQMPNRGPNQF